MIALRTGTWMVAAMSVFLGASAWGRTEAQVRHVPGEFATIQEAVDAADPGDVIDVGPGDHCGATIDRPVTLVGHGRATIVGCDTGPIVFGSEHAGFFLPGAGGESPASGTRIIGFTFDGRGVSGDNLGPLAMAVFGRFAHDVRVIGNVFLGTVQAITNTAGDRWVIAHNEIRDLTLFDCTGALCGGGAGIIVQVARGDVAVDGGGANPLNRPKGNVIFGNDVEGSIPDGFDVFSMVGIFVFAADRTLVERNTVSIPDNPAADATGEGILVDDTCCGDPVPVVPGARHTSILFNDASDSEFGIVVDGTGGANTQGLKLFGNRGTVLVEGEVVEGRRPRRHPHHCGAR